MLLFSPFYSYLSCPPSPSCCAELAPHYKLHILLLLNYFHYMYKPSQLRRALPSVEHFVFCHPDSSLLNTAVFCTSTHVAQHYWPQLPLAASVHEATQRLFKPG
jgi:hypothetical protein